ncbi:hypothetical protein [Burkholderia anthina]|uniref:hypothetical protein n=2 Tax=Burkholderiaceae TaxID=119060 RepID=UPI00158EF449|nr:hypothetical protein [Burkholderia anthina]
MGIASRSFALRRHAPGGHSNAGSARVATPDRGRAARRAPVVGQAGFDGTGNLPTNASAAATHCIGQTTVCRGAQLIMLRRWPKTVESCGAADPNRDNRHFGDA